MRSELGIRAAIILAATIAASIATQAQAWQIKKTANAFTGTDTITAYTSSKNGGGFLVRCFEGDMQFYLQIPDGLKLKEFSFLGLTEPMTPPARFRIDDSQAFSDDGGKLLEFEGRRFQRLSLLSWNSSPIDEILGRLITGATLIYQIPAETGSVYRLSLGGSANAIRTAYQECKKFVSRERQRNEETDADDRPRFEGQERLEMDRLIQQHSPTAVSLSQSVKRQIAPCWSIPAGAQGSANMSVAIRIQLTPDGALAEAPRIEDSGRMTIDPFFRSVAESALRALRNPRCMPLKLPSDQYETWKDITFVFDPHEALESNFR